MVYMINIFFLNRMLIEAHLYATRAKRMLYSRRKGKRKRKEKKNRK